MSRRVVAVDPTAEHRDRRPARVERAAVRLSVDAAREPAHHDEPRAAQLAPEHPRHVRPVRRTSPRAHDRDRRPPQHLDVGGATDEQPGRRIVNRPEKRWEPRVVTPDPLDALLAKPRQIRVLVEGPDERSEGAVPRSSHEVGVVRGGEGGQGEFAHGAPSSVGER